MLQKQKENIFGFPSTDRDLLEFDKTATFFCPAKLHEKEASFSTNNTDATRETSEKSTPPQPTKAEPRKKICTVKRVVPVQINNITKALNRNNLINLPLISSRVNSAVERSHRELTSSLTRNSSQQSSRRDLDLSDNVTSQKPSVHQTPKASIKSIIIHKRLPSDQSERRPYNLNQQLITEPLMVDDDHGFDLLLNTKLLSHNNSKPRLKVTKVNRIKVLSALPNTEDRTRTEDTVSMLNSTGEDRGLKIDTRIREMINSNVEDLKISSRLYPMTTKARNLSTLALPEPMNTPISRLLSATPLLVNDDELPLISPTTSYRRMNSSNNGSRPPLTLEPIKVFHDMHTPMREQVESAIGSTRYYPESTKNVKTEGLYDNNYALSPPQQNGSFFNFKNQLSNSGKKEPLDHQQKLQKRVNIKFRNEEAVLNKLFRSVSIKKKE